jgi:hypothetical protein
MKLRKMVLVTLLVLLLNSCAILRHETPDGTKVVYFRLFTTAESIKGRVGDARVEINGQQIDVSALQTLLNLLSATANPAK